MAKSREDLQELLTTVIDVSASYGLLIDPKKNKVMSIEKGHECIVVTFGANV